MTPNPIPAADRAWRHFGPQVVFWLTCVAGLVTDLWTKYWAWERYWHPWPGATGGGHDEVIIPHVLKFTAVKNMGALFGIGQGQVTFFIVASLAAIAVVFVLFANAGRRQWGLHIAAGLIMAGALGNLYDRWKYGYVRDFIHIYAEIRDYPIWRYIFNVADMLLVIGVGILLIHWYITPRLAPAPEQPAEAPPADPANPPAAEPAPATISDATAATPPVTDQPPRST